MSNLLTTSTFKNIDKTNVKCAFFISHSLCHPKLNEVVSKFSKDCLNVAQDAPKVDQVAPNPPKIAQDSPDMGHEKTSATQAGVEKHR